MREELLVLMNRDRNRANREGEQINPYERWQQEAEY